MEAAAWRSHRLLAQPLRLFLSMSRHGVTTRTARVTTIGLSFATVASALRGLWSTASDLNSNITPAVAAARQPGSRQGACKVCTARITSGAVINSMLHAAAADVQRSLSLAAGFRRVCTLARSFSLTLRPASTISSAMTSEAQIPPEEVVRWAPVRCSSSQRLELAARRLRHIWERSVEQSRRQMLGLPPPPPPVGRRLPGSSPSSRASVHLPLRRVGIIGAGANTKTRHIPNLQEIPGVKLVSVCNRSLASSRAAAQQFGIPHATDNWREVVQHPEVDAVVIGTWWVPHCCWWDPGRQ